MNVQELQDLQDAIKESGLPVSEVVKYIKHGPEMVEALKDMCDYCGPDTSCWGCPSKTTLAKLEEA